MAYYVTGGARRSAARARLMRRPSLAHHETLTVAGPIVIPT